MKRKDSQQIFHRITTPCGRGHKRYTNLPSPPSRPAFTTPRLRKPNAEMRTVDSAQYAERRQTILTAARRCFARAGFRGATMQQICKEAGMSAGHLYHYFSGKDAIIEALVAQDEALANDALLRIEIDADPVQALTAELMQACGYDKETKAIAFDMVT